MQTAKINGNRKWTEEEITDILAEDRPSDKTLALRLNRSTRAIDSKRYWVKNPEKKSELRKTWKNKNLKKYKKIQKNYYGQSSNNIENLNQRWTAHDINLIIAKNREPDRILSKKLGRTISSIQTMRNTIKKQKLKNRSRK